MTVYWVDPYIDTPNGGIHGTTDTTTRNGSYSAPWGFDQLFSTDANPYSINGTNLTNSDEIRLKGQALSSYYYNIGTTGNKVTVTGVASSYLNYDTSYETNVGSWKTALSNLSDTVGVMVVHDQELYGSNKYTFVNTTTNAHNAGSGTMPITISNNRYSHSAYFQALVGIDSSRNLELSFLDPDYAYDLSISSNTYYMAWRPNSGDGLTITDGWDSETTRNGVTILMLRDTDTTGRYLYLFKTSSSYGIITDLRNTHFIHYHPTQYYHNKYYYWYSYNFTETYYCKIGGIYNSNTNAWNYWSGHSSTSWQSGGEDYTWDVGNWCHGRYYFWNFSGNSSNRPKLRIQNWLFGQGPYYNGSYQDLYLGNMFLYTQYSGSGFFYTNNGNNKIWVLDGAHIFAVSSGPKSIDDYGVFQGIEGTAPYSVTTTPDRPTRYPGAGNGGPFYAGMKSPSRYLIDTSYQIPLSSVNWYDVLGVKAFENTSSISQYASNIVNSPFGILQCDSDYNNINSNLLVNKSTYLHSSYFLDQNFTFARNTYDNKPISLWQHQTTTTNSVFPALISWNDSADMIVKNTNQSDAGNKWFIKSFLFDTPDLTGMNTLTVSQDMIKIGNITQQPNWSVFPIRNNSDGARYSGSVNTSDTSKYVWSQTFSAGELDSAADYMGIQIQVYNTTSNTKDDGFRIKPPTFTVT
jgi:hypothetical protein